MDRLRNGSLATLTAAAAVYLLHEGAPALVPVFASVLFAYALEPLVALLVRWRFPRLLAATLICVLIGILVGVTVRAAGARVLGFASDLPATVATIQKSLAQPDHGSPGVLDRLRSAAAILNGAATRKPGGGPPRVVIVEPPFDVQQYLIDATRGVASGAASLIAIALLTFLLLAAGDLFKRKLLELAGPGLQQRRVTLDVIKTIDRQIERYLVVRLLISAIVAIGTGVPLWALGLDHAVLWGTVAGVLNVLPILGPSVAIALVAAAAFVQFQTVAMTAAAGGIAAAVAALEGNLITPVLTGRAGELNTVAVFVGVLFWGWEWGLWGLLLAIPIMVAAKAAADRIDGLHPIGELLGR